MFRVDVARVKDTGEGNEHYFAQRRQGFARDQKLHCGFAGPFCLCVKIKNPWACNLFKQHVVRYRKNLETGNQ